MQLQILNVSECYESPTNPRGTDFAGKQFDELVASVKEKGVLVPVLVRKTSSSRHSAAYEVIAGNRRLRAAMQAGITEIPAMLVEMNDGEAREAQIVENLQRQDVHPLEEGEAYRQLIEESKLEVAAVAARVGKSESYVKQRLFLTNLEDKPKAAYRSGKINDGHAVLIAKLSAHDQLRALKQATDRYETMSVKDLKDWIERNIYSQLDTQPWLSAAFPVEEMENVVGKCVECEPARAALFGNVKQGACTDLKCWTRKMAKYIEFRAKQGGLRKLSTEYGTPPNGMIGRDAYVIVAKKGKDRCDSVEGAIVAQGGDIGQEVDVCADKDCTTHFGQRSHYRTTPQEQAKRKKEQEKEQAKRTKFDVALSESISKVTLPLSEKHLDALLDIALANTSTSFLMPICKRHSLKGDKTKDGGRDYRTPLRQLAEGGGNDGKLRMVFELNLPTYSQYSDFAELTKRIPKL